MIVIIGLIVLIAAVIVGVSGALANGGNAHEMAGQFSVFGYHVTGSTGTLFLCGIVVGAVGLAGLSLVLAGHRYTARRGITARRELNTPRPSTTATRRGAWSSRIRASREPVAAVAAPVTSSDAEPVK